jgi:hypothetical protein
MSSSIGKKASEPLINSTYSFFLTIFTVYVMREIMNSRLFTFLYLSLDVGLHMGRIILLSPTIISLMLTRSS